MKMKILTFDDFSLFKRSFGFGVFAALVFTILPFYLWSRGIRKVGPGRATIFVFLNPLVACLLSVFGFKDMPINAFTGGGMVLILFGLLLNLGFKGVAIKVMPRPIIRALSLLIVIYPLAFPVICGLVFGWEGDRLLRLLLHPFHLLVIILSILASWMIFTMSRFAVPILGLFLAALIGESLAFMEQVFDPSFLILLILISITVFGLISVGMLNIRRAHRKDCDLCVDLSIEGGATVNANLVNLSDTGCRLMLADNSGELIFTQNQIASIRISTEKYQKEFKVKIVRGGKNQFRGKFIDVTYEQRKLIHDLISKNLNTKKLVI